MRPRSASRPGIAASSAGSASAATGATGGDHRRSRQPAQQRAEKLLGIDRLGDEVVHARRLAALAILVEGIGGHRQDGQRRAAGQRADGARRLQTVHARHLHIHEDQVVAAATRLLQRLKAVVGDLHLQSDLGQEFHRDFLVDLVVLGQQDASAGRHGLQAQFGNSGRLGQFFQAELALAETGGKPEGAALAGHALRAGLAAHQARQPPGDGEPEAGAAVAARGGGIDLLEGREQVRDLLRRNADAGVRHFEAHQQVGCRFLHLGSGAR